MLKTFALWSIALYQRYLSPRKGFGCAYRIHAGGAGCSGFGKRAIAKEGFFLGLVLLRRRLSKCAWHAERNSICAPGRRPRALGSQGGFADCDCGGCDAPNCNTPDCDTPSCKGSGCDTPKACDGRPGRGLSRVCDFLDVFSSCGGGGSKGESRRRARREKRRGAKKGADE